MGLIGTAAMDDPFGSSALIGGDGVSAIAKLANRVGFMVSPAVVSPSKINLIRISRRCNAVALS